MDYTIRVSFKSDGFVKITKDKEKVRECNPVEFQSKKPLCKYYGIFSRNGSGTRD